VSSWIDYRAIWEIVVVGLLAGAGLPALFAVGMRVLGTPAKGAVGAAGPARPARSDHLVGGNPAAMAIAGLCFAICVGAVGYGIYIIVVSGHASA
jgi:hypothetical protein